MIAKLRLSKKGMVKSAPLVVLLGAFLVSPALSLRLSPYDYERGGLDDQALIEERNNNSFAIILGEVRTNLSDLLFVKTERYLHRGVAYMPHLNYDKMAQTGEIEDRDTETASVHDHDDHDDHDHEGHDHDDHEGYDHADHDPHDHGDHEGHDHDAHEGHDHSEQEPSPYEAEEGHEAVATVIPDANSDFRGPIGALHRRVKPWMDPNAEHEHTSGEELLPWYRLMTISNPKNVRAYLIGSWWLKTKRDDVFLNEALDFLAEGLMENSKAYQLHLMRGYVFMEMDSDEQAWPEFIKAAELVKVNRPVNGVENPRWTDYEEDDARAACRLAVIMERRLGDPAKALEMATRYNEVLGGDGRLEVNIEEIKAELMAN